MLNVGNSLTPEAIAKQELRLEAIAIRLLGIFFLCYVFIVLSSFVSAKREHESLSSLRSSMEPQNSGWLMQHLGGDTMRTSARNCPHLPTRKSKTQKENEKKNKQRGIVIV